MTPEQIDALSPEELTIAVAERMGWTVIEGVSPRDTAGVIHCVNGRSESHYPITAALSMPALNSRRRSRMRIS